MQNLDNLIATVWEFYDSNGRHDMPWRQPNAEGEFNPYYVLVSELMLQQTQVQRVTPKYLAFIQRFPTVESLAQATLSEVLQLWSGLGYNRRAKFLWQSAVAVHGRHNGQFPYEYKSLLDLPGVGPNTAGAILAYAYDVPVAFTETNVRSVFIHHCFGLGQQVSDKALQPLIETAVLRATQSGNPNHTPRTWYWALMDYGNYLKKTLPNPSRRSKSYKRQTTFHGSLRQVRGQVLKLLTNGQQSYSALQQEIADDRLAEVLQALTREELIKQNGSSYHLGA
jgi:A/G-specific adenine glycosylase